MNNVRDRLIIGGAILIAIGDMCLMAFKGFSGEGIIRDVLLLLGTAYKGNPAPPDISTTTETTTSGTELKPISQGSPVGNAAHPPAIAPPPRATLSDKDGTNV